MWASSDCRTSPLKLGRWCMPIWTIAAPHVVCMRPFDRATCFGHRYWPWPSPRCTIFPRPSAKTLASWWPPAMPESECCPFPPMRCGVPRPANWSVERWPNCSPAINKIQKSKSSKFKRGPIEWSGPIVTLGRTPNPYPTPAPALEAESDTWYTDGYTALDSSNESSFQAIS